MKTSMFVAIVVLIVLIIALFFLAAGDSEMSTTTEGEAMIDDGATGEVGVAQSLVLDGSGLASLEQGHYEGWAIYGDEKVSTGRFNVNSEDGSLQDLEGSAVDSFALDRNLLEADSIVVTIEPDGDTDDIPSGIVVLSGDVQGQSEVALRFPVDFSSASGKYILATPTNGAETDETSGIWFLSLETGEPTISLGLPELPSGWVYEGWGVHGGVPITTGQFTAVNAVDDFDGFSGEEAGPPFPGEDFLVNAPAAVTGGFPINLADGASLAVISVEPDLDGVDPTGDGPAQAKPLVAEIALDAADHETFVMGLNLDSVPRGTASLR